MSGPLTSAERMAIALSHREPDRVPFFLPLTLHGARALGVTIREFHARPDLVVEAQLLFRERYRHDVVTAATSAAVDNTAFGGTLLFREDGPPNSGAPPLASIDAIRTLELPRIEDCPELLAGLEATRSLRRAVGDDVPVLGTVVGPFSLPVMQLGYERYLHLIESHPVLLSRLLEVNEEFVVRWATAQVDAGATLLACFEPLASPTCTPVSTWKGAGYEVLARTLARIAAPVVVHLASGRAVPVIDELAAAGAAGVGVSSEDDLVEAKAACAGRLNVAGNLNALTMWRWTRDDAERAVRDAIRRGAAGGGFLLMDNHGEIPWQVPEHVLAAISESVLRWGRYPLDVDGVDA